MKSYYRSVALLVLSASLSIPSSTNAQGLFDFLDPCIGARNDFEKQRAGVMSQIDTKIQNVDSAVATDQFKEFWWKEKRAALREFFDAKVAPILGEAGISKGKMMDAAFETWIEKQIHKNGDHAHIDGLINSEYRRLLKLALLKEKGATTAELDKARSQMYSSCPQDVGSQLFRGVLVVTTAPIGIVTNNLESAKNESGELAKVLRGTTGISVDAIVKQGPLGGENSEARKACNAVAGVLGGRCN